MKGAQQWNTMTIWWWLCDHMSQTVQNTLELGEVGFCNTRQKWITVTIEKGMSLPVPRGKTNNTGARTFHSCATSLWNTLPLSVRSAIFSCYLQETSQDTSLWLGLSPIDACTPNGPLMLRNCFITFAVEYRFGCNATELGFAGNIGAIKMYLVDWLIDWLTDWILSFILVTDAKVLWIVNIFFNKNPLHMSCWGIDALHHCVFRAWSYAGMYMMCACAVVYNWTVWSQLPAKFGCRSGCEPGSSDWYNLVPRSSLSQPHLSSGRLRENSGIKSEKRKTGKNARGKLLSL